MAGVGYFKLAPANFKKAFGGSNFAPQVCAGTFQKLFSGNIFKKHFAGTFKNTFSGNNFMAGTFLAGSLIFFIIRKLNKILLFKNKGSETQP